MKSDRRGGGRGYEGWRERLRGRTEEGERKNNVHGTVVEKGKRFRSEWRKGEKGGARN